MFPAIFLVITIVFVLLLFVWAVSLLLTMFRGAPFIASHPEAVDNIVDLACPKPGQKIIDLGSGDGRLVIELAKRGAEAHGYEINPFLVLWSRWKIHQTKVNDQAKIHWGDFWRAKLDSYDTIIIFGIKHIMQRMQSKLEKEAIPHARIIVNCFPLPSWEPITKKETILLYDKSQNMKQGAPQPDTLDG